jgi:iron complex transport system substrate-binding protein
MAHLPQRIVCLTTETVEVLYALGEEHRIVGISGYTVRPPRARKEKPKVFAFTSGDLNKILAVRPDLVFSFSNLQADIARELIQAGVAVHAFNQRSVEDILAMIETVGRLVGAEARALELVAALEAQIAAARAAGARIVERAGRRPRVFFEEWDEPLISGIGWVSELIGIAGGDDIFAEKAREKAATGRIVSPADVVEAAPDIILASWCGKKVVPDRIRQRPGWDRIPAVRNGRIVEIKSPLILTPGPVAIEEGLPALLRIFEDWAAAA